MKNQTKAIHCDFPHDDAYGAIGMPVYHTAAYEFKTAEEMIDVFCGRVLEPDYSRVMNPTVTFFENKIKAITGAKDVIALNSGMAAISNALMAVSASGKNIVSSRHMFGNSYALINTTLSRFGVEAKLCDLTCLEEVEAAIDENTCCVFLETVTNPQMEVADLKGLAGITRRHKIPLIADTTIIPFTQFSSRELGVDVEIVSSTKYLSGGATSIGGLIIDNGTFEGFGDKIRFEMIFNLGAYMTPHVAYMQTLGLESLDARYRVQSANTQELAQRLKGVAAIKKVNYVGLQDNPYYALAREQFGPTSGAMMTIDLESEQACFAFLNKLKVFKRATNLFDNKSLAIHPYSTIFGGFDEQTKAAMGLRDTTVRLSVGLEDVEDLYEDIINAL